MPSHPDTQIWCKAKIVTILDEIPIHDSAQSEGAKLASANSPRLPTRYRLSAEPDASWAFVSVECWSARSSPTLIQKENDQFKGLPQEYPQLQFCRSVRTMMHCLPDGLERLSFRGQQWAGATTRRSVPSQKSFPMSEGIRIVPLPEQMREMRESDYGR